MFPMWADTGRWHLAKPVAQGALQQAPYIQAGSSPGAYTLAVEVRLSTSGVLLTGSLGMSELCGASARGAPKHCS